MNIDLKPYYDVYRFKYHSASQLTRVVTESWFKDNMYCPFCGKENPYQIQLEELVGQDVIYNWTEYLKRVSYIS